jgi:phospholipid transport system substrate-binding protein
MLRRDFLHTLKGACAGAALAMAGSVALAQAAAAPTAAPEAPDALVQRLSNEVINTVKSDRQIQAGDVSRIIALVEQKIVPNVNVERMTALSVGRYWRQATPEQQKRLQDEFKALMIRTYSGALSQIRDQTVVLRPLRAAPEDTDVIVRTEVRGRGDPIQLDYRLEKTSTGWKLYDLNVLGVWLVETQRASFAQEISANGIDGLINKLSERNRAALARRS